ncbi:regulatory protein, luxR family [Amycolatopsis sacchari]|uniref:Regulatory protein, luxR family n=1 Tax=Amycolatopsis sacchari TaxID=115433 RepID=A0A1I3RFF6_9PSEU|nr:regulatory protein, luxR family [Amycolatopsis sacchari]
MVVQVSATPVLAGRDDELRRLTGAVRSAPGGERVLVVSGEPGSGKSALLEAAAVVAGELGQRVLQAAGSESEAGLAFAGLHQLLRPVLAAADALLPGQRAALLGAVGLGTPPGRPDPWEVGLAVLTLLSDLGDQAPLCVVVDDAQWLDRASLDVLSFVARRLEGEPVTLLVAARDGEPLPGLDQFAPRIVLEPLDAGAATRVLAAQPVTLTAWARQQVLDQAAGNPLALRELARAAAADPAVLDPAPGPFPVGDRLEGLFGAHLDALPEATRQALLLLAAADAADPARYVSAVLPATDEVWLPARRAALVRPAGDRLVFRHPLIRSAVYHRASFADRRAAHLRLAAALTDEPDRRAWHLAAVAVPPDPAAAAELERTADRARRRGGHAAAAAALERAASLAASRADAARLLLAAAGAAAFTGDLGWVERLADSARSLSDDPAVERAATLLAGQLTSLTAEHDVAFSTLALIARATLERDPEAALAALSWAAVVCFYSGSSPMRSELRALLAGLPSGTDDVAAAWTAVVSEPFTGRADAVAGLPSLVEAVRDRPDRLVMVAIVAWLLDEPVLAARTFDDAFALWRTTGPLPNGLGCAAALAYLERGRWSQAHVVCDDVTAVGQATGLVHAVACADAVRAMVSASQGDTARARELAEGALTAVDPEASRSVAAYARRALGAAAAVEGDHETAYQQYRSLFEADGTPTHYHACYAAVPELAAAAARTGHGREAELIVEQSEKDLGNEVSPRLAALFQRARALLAEPEHAEGHFKAALADAALAPWPFERAQTLLEYAEWMRRRRRIAEARPLLTAALEVFRRLGARPWIERAQGELRASGMDVVEAVPDAIARLSPQQQQIVQLAARGLTNREIGDRLFLSPRTVGSHLYRTFPKLGVTTRAQLRDLLG